MSLSAFEKMALAGDLARLGAEASPHTATPQDNCLRHGDGRPSQQGVPTPSGLAVGDTFERVYSCRRPGVPLGMDTFRHVEAIHREAPGKLQVTDTLVFPQHRPRVSRCYTVAASGDAIHREAQPWTIDTSHIAGLRARVEARVVAHHLRPELATADERLTVILDEAACTPPETAQEG